MTTNHLVQAANVGTSTQYFDNTDYKPNEESHAGRSTTKENFSNSLTCSSTPSPRVHSELRVLKMGICSKLNDQCLRQIATYCPELCELDIKGCYNTTDDGILSIARGCQRLRLLDISTSYTKQMLLSDRSLVTIATHCKNLRQLNIQKNDLMSLDGVRYFCDRCPLPITVILTSRCHDIQRTDILSTDKSDNAFKMVKSNFSMILLVLEIFTKCYCTIPMKTFFSKNDRFKNLFVRLYKKDTTGSEWFFLLNFPFLVPTIWNDKVLR